MTRLRSDIVWTRVYGVKDDMKLKFTSSATLAPLEALNGPMARSYHLGQHRSGTFPSSQHVPGRELLDTKWLE